MKKYVVGAVIVALFAIGGVGAFLVLTNQDRVNEPITSANSSLVEGSPKVDACTVLPESIVTEWIGKKVQKISTPVATIGSSDNHVSTCNYVANALEENDVTTEGPKLSGANLLVYIARSANGAVTNKSQFKELPTNVKTVDNIGDIAYYNPDFRQLHVLKGNNWYVLTAFKDSILNSTVESTTELAKKLTFK
jgi:hypothetical protein